ncbi:MAG: hypothetical protein JXB50_01765 [Spirochaetes bacterium]|nr:hypothetical protein [Spirochaetota bacterium]
MSNKHNKIDIQINNENSDNIFFSQELFNLLKKGYTIIDINNNSKNLILNINDKLDCNCSIISYSSNNYESLKLKYELKNLKNHLVFNTTFDNNSLNNNSADVIIGNNILSHKNKKISSEINRVLNKNGKIYFIENILLNKLPNNIYSRNEINPVGNITKIIERNLKYIKDCEYRIKITGIGKFNYNSDDYNGYLEFCDIFKANVLKDKNLMNNILTFIIKGSLIYSNKAA